MEIQKEYIIVVNGRPYFSVVDVNHLSAVNVYVGKCIHTCPTGIFMPFETPLFIEPALSISPLFSERVVLCALRPQKHGLQ